MRLSNSPEAPNTNIREDLYEHIAIMRNATISVTPRAVVRTRPRAHRHHEDTNRIPEIVPGILAEDRYRGVPGGMSRKCMTEGIPVTHRCMLGFSCVSEFSAA